jgi:hypothetical protein
MRPIRFAFVALNFVALSTCASWGDELPIDLKDLPSGVRQAADKAVASAKWADAFVEDEEEEAVYRIKGADAKGRPVVVEIDSEMKVALLETTFNADQLGDLPSQILKAADAGGAGARWSGGVVREEEERTEYRFKGADAQGRTLEAVIAVEIHAEVETTLDLKELPTPLADALRPIAGATWAKAALKRSDGETTYKADGADDKGRELTVTVDGEGRAEIRTELTAGDVPAVVLEALKAKLPSYHTTSSASVARPDGVSYVFECEDQEGDEKTATVSADGKSVKIEGEDDDEKDEA